MSKRSSKPSFEEVIAALQQPETFRGQQGSAAVDDPVDRVEHHETHISDIFLAGQFAYKVKKPVKTSFLDYSTLALRKHFCEKEFELDSRYAQDLYLGVVPITFDGQKIGLDGTGATIEYAVKMRRFENDALLASRVRQRKVDASDVEAIATRIARFHESAERAEEERCKRAGRFATENIDDVFQTLRETTEDRWKEEIDRLMSWSSAFIAERQDVFIARSLNGFVRSCHGDLHLENIVHWRGAYCPFDGIEFNEDLRWIDVANDAGFLVMDFAAYNHVSFGRLFLNRYLEQTGDYDALKVMRWFLIYRALIRAMVAGVKSKQHTDDPDNFDASIADARRHIELAITLSQPSPPSLTITHGVSGSGKTWQSDHLIRRTDAIRIRSDVERLRNPTSAATDTRETSSNRYSSDDDGRYDPKARDRVYRRLQQLASQVIRSGYGVIVDATFLKRSHRRDFQQIAERLGVRFQILSCHADKSELQRRIQQRSEQGNDASEADLQVLERQLENQQPLSEEEQKWVSGPAE